MACGALASTMAAAYDDTVWNCKEDEHFCVLLAELGFTWEVRSNMHNTMLLAPNPGFVCFPMLPEIDSDSDSDGPPPLVSDSGSDSQSTDVGLAGELYDDDDDDDASSFSD